jgi:hypothetical protein
VQAQDVGAAQVIVLNVFGSDINRRMQEGQTLIRDQKIRTGTASAAELIFLDDPQLVIGARSEVTIDRFIFDPDANVAKASLNIRKRLLWFASARAKLNVSVNTRVATLGIRGTIFDVLATSRATKLGVHEGAVQVDSAVGSQVVGAGDVLRITSAAALVALDGPSEEMQAAIKETYGLLGPRGITEAGHPRSSRTRHGGHGGGARGAGRSHQSRRGFLPRHCRQRLRKPALP